MQKTLMTEMAVPTIVALQRPTVSIGLLLLGRLHDVGGGAHGDLSSYHYMILDHIISYHKLYIMLPISTF